MTYIDVLEAIAGRVASLWPERMLYRDFCPADHKRPSGFLYVERAEMEDVNLGLVQWSLEARLDEIAGRLRKKEITVPTDLLGAALF